jgi:mannose-6-phosphate isomerase-like protein (cupin superfamily)
MEVVDHRTAIGFAAEKLQKNPLFDSEHFFCDLYCLRPGQFQKLHSHDGSDKVYWVLAGTVRCVVGEEERDLQVGELTIARSGQAHGVRNESQADAVLAVFMAPKPQRG